MVLDPLLLVIVDCIIGNWEFGDAFKLYNHFQFEEVLVVVRSCGHLAVPLTAICPLALHSTPVFFVFA